MNNNLLLAVMWGLLIERLTIRVSTELILLFTTWPTHFLKEARK